MVTSLINFISREYALHGLDDKNNLNIDQHILTISSVFLLNQGTLEI